MCSTKDTLCNQRHSQTVLISKTLKFKHMSVGHNSKGKKCSRQHRVVDILKDENQTW